jgi:hypothetical protein
MFPTFRYEIGINSRISRAPAARYANASVTSLNRAVRVAAAKMPERRESPRGRSFRNLPLAELEAETGQPRPNRLSTALLHNGKVLR